MNIEQAKKQISAIDAIIDKLDKRIQQIENNPEDAKKSISQWDVKEEIKDRWIKLLEENDHEVVLEKINKFLLKWTGRKLKYEALLAVFGKEGVDNTGELIQLYIHDSVAPALCRQDDCSHVEHDGHCEHGNPSIISVLLGV